jgi:hypothetical protein
LGSDLSKNDSFHQGQESAKMRMNQQMRQRGRIFRLSQVYFLLRVEHAEIAREAL